MSEGISWPCHFETLVLPDKVLKILIIFGRLTLGKSIYSDTESKLSNS